MSVQARGRPSVIGGAGVRGEQFKQVKLGVWESFFPLILAGKTKSTFIFSLPTFGSTICLFFFERSWRARPGIGSAVLHMEGNARVKKGGSGL